jgi:hypothetical protein
MTIIFVAQPVIRNIKVSVNKSSWPNATPPSDIMNLPSIWQADVGIALLNTALWTRPPRYTGFDLADFWAWLRYMRAFADTPDLRLRQEWQDLDPHQKTILSDEVGVGCR